MPSDPRIPASVKRFCHNVTLRAWISAGLMFACFHELLIKFAIADCGDQGVNHRWQFVER